MKLSIIVTAFLSTLTTATRIAYDAGYDEAERSLSVVSCSNGMNGLINNYSWEKQSEVHYFPYIGAFEAVKGWNSENCGTCWKVSWRGKSLYITAVDHADHGAILSLQALNELTGGHAVEYGVVDGTVERANGSFCGLRN